MTWMIKLARYNETTASTFGIILNLLLIYIVCTVKSKVGNISRILLQNCFLDITLAVATFLAGVHPFIINRIYYIVIGSWLNVYGFECASFLIAFYGASVMLSIQALPVPFYVRYQILCNIRISRHLSHHTNTFKQTKIPNKQLHRTLIAQAFGPLIVGNGPIFLLIVMIFVGIENNNASIALSSMFGYVGVVNPLAALIIISPYRNHITQIFKIRRTASVHASAIVSIPNTNSVARSMPNILLPH
uniref:G-protein coupled receptors family 1 profile domain-containing protein n=1 Tax=Panagrolaimus sp. PS1159 TaxID=55785 RepID=A0AC35FC57_9BILA